MSQQGVQGMALGERLRRLRETAGFTQEELAARAQLTAKGVAAIERGRSRRPLPQTIRALAAALGLANDEARELFALAKGHYTTSAMLPGADTPPPPASQLPRTLTPLIGRDGAIKAIVTALAMDGARLVTLTGPGGVGKTRLALAVAEAVAGAYPDGITFVPLLSLSDPAAVIPAIARALGVQERGGWPLREALHPWARERRALLVIDNLEHLLEVTPEIATLLAAGPRLAILATSRAPLRLRGEREWLVPPLTVPDDSAGAITPQTAPVRLATIPAVRLFIDRTRAVCPDFALTPDNAATIAAICRRLDGLPLALELAAARLRALPPAALLDRLDAALPLLTGGARDLPAHQRTMRDTIAWSYALLPPTEQRLLRRLGPFVGGWTLAAAEVALAGAGHGGDDRERTGTTPRQGNGDALGALSELVEQSLVVKVESGDGDRVSYRFLEPIRQFALEQLVQHGEEEEAGAAHAAHYLALALRGEMAFFEAAMARWLDCFDAERENLRAALDWFLRQDNLEDAARLGWLLHRFWWIRGYLAEGRRWRAAILPSRGRLTPPRRAIALLTAAFLAYAEGDHETTGELLQEGVPLARASGQPVLFTLTLGLGGLAALGRGEVAHARAQLTEALGVAEANGDRWDIGMMQNFLGYVALAEGDNARANMYLEEAAKSWRQSGSDWDLAVNLNMRSALAEWREDYPLAEALTRESMTLLRPLGDTWVSVYALGQLAGVAIHKGHFVHAARLLGATEQLRHTVGTTILFASDRALHERRIATLRTALTAAEFARAWAAGQRLTLSQALAEAETTTAAAE